MLIDFSQGENTVREKFMLIDPEQFQGFYSRLVEPLLHKLLLELLQWTVKRSKPPEEAEKEPVNISLRSMTRKIELF